VSPTGDDNEREGWQGDAEDGGGWDGRADEAERIQRKKADGKEQHPTE